MATHRTTSLTGRRQGLPHLDVGSSLYCNNGVAPYVSRACSGDHGKHRALFHEGKVLFLLKSTHTTHMFWPKRSTKLSEILDICQLTVYLFIFEMRPLYIGQTSLKLIILLTVGMYTCISINEKNRCEAQRLFYRFSYWWKQFMSCIFVDCRIVLNKKWLP